MDEDSHNGGRGAVSVSSRGGGRRARSGSADLLALERSLSGTNADDWLDCQPVLDEESTLEAGKTVRGSVTFEITNSN